MEPKFQHLPRLFQFSSEVKRRGSILLLALWAICFLSVLAVTLGLEVRQKVSLVGRLDERAKLRFISEAGIQKAIIYLRKNAAGAYYDSFRDTFVNNPTFFKDIDMAGGSFSVGGNFQNNLAGDVSFRYSLIDEKGKDQYQFCRSSHFGEVISGGFGVG